MGRKKVLSKEEIVEASMDLIQTKGYEFVSIRNIARALECSPQPIYSQFESIKAVDQVLSQAIYDKMLKDYMLKENGEDPFLQLGLGYIMFAKEQPRLFEFLYFSKRNLGINDGNYNQLIKKAGQGDVMNSLDENLVKKIHQKISIFTHGLAVQVMARPDLYTEDEIRNLLIDTSRFIGEGERNREN